MRIEDYRTTPFGEPRRTPGRYGYVAFFPRRLPRKLALRNETILLLTDTEAVLGELSGLGHLVPNPHLLIRPYVLREALSSTRIEGTRATLMDVLEVQASGEPANTDVEEVLNYIAALEWGLTALQRLPLSVRLICEIHSRLLAGVRGAQRTPGELRRTQNWIGAPGSTLETAHYVPPPVEQLNELLGDWERFLHEEDGLPILVRNAMAHYQFETLHPFLDGNGRLGRLLIVFLLISRGRLSAPLLYVSSFLEQHRGDYYASLQMIRERGDVDPWIELFLTAVKTSAVDAVIRAREIVALRESFRAATTGVRSSNAAAAVDLIFEFPILSAAVVMNRLKITRTTALSLLRDLSAANILEPFERGRRGQLRYVSPRLLATISESPMAGHRADSFQGVHPSASAPEEG